VVMLKDLSENFIGEEKSNVLLKVQDKTRGRKIWTSLNRPKKKKKQVRTTRITSELMGNHPGTEVALLKKESVLSSEEKGCEAGANKGL